MITIWENGTRKKYSQENILIKKSEKNTMMCEKYLLEEIQ